MPQMPRATDSPSAMPAVPLAGKYLTFCLGAEEYGIAILKVAEIVRLMPIAAMPGAPAFVRGVINLRGQVLPVVDLRGRLGREPVPDSGDTCIVIVHIEEEGLAVRVGLLVDAVCEVIDVAADDVEPTPRFGAPIDTAYVRGLAKSGGSVRILLDTDRILSGEEARQLAGN